MIFVDPSKARNTFIRKVFLKLPPLCKLDEDRSSKDQKLLLTIFKSSGKLNLSKFVKKLFLTKLTRKNTFFLFSLSLKTLEKKTTQQNR